MRPHYPWNACNKCGEPLLANLAHGLPSGQVLVQPMGSTPRMFFIGRASSVDVQPVTAYKLEGYSAPAESAAFRPCPAASRLQEVRNNHPHHLPLAAAIPAQA